MQVRSFLDRFSWSRWLLIAGIAASALGMESACDGAAFSGSGGPGKSDADAGSPGSDGTAGADRGSDSTGGKSFGGHPSTMAGRGGNETGISGEAPTESSASGGSGAAGDVGMGDSGFGGASAGVGTGGAPGIVGHRYARLVALTSIPNDSLTSVGEFELLDASGDSLPRTSWAVNVDSEELVDSYSPGDAAIDGDVNTCWLTEWGDFIAPLPHTLTIDMAETELVSGFRYTPRQDWYNGRIGKWELYLSNDPNDFGTPVASGSFPDSTVVTTKTFAVQ